MLRPLLLAAVLALPTLASAQEANPHVAARQAQMGLLAYNLGVLGGMARGNMAYDAAVASTAATNVYHLAMVDGSRSWVPGTDTMSIDGTRALPAIWDNPDDFAAKYAALVPAAEVMVTAAGQSLEALQAAMGGLGGACGGCHQAYRQPEN